MQIQLSEFMQKKINESEIKLEQSYSFGKFYYHWIFGIFICESIVLW